MSKYGNLLFSKETLQTNPIPQSISTAKQEMNSAGGFVFSLDKFKRLERFLILGSDSNTYYATGAQLTKENAKCVNECWNEDLARTQRIIYTISTEGRAAKNSPAIFAVALGTIHPNEHVRKAAFELVPKVCRTSTHLFEFVDTCRALGKGWGRGMKNCVANWYNLKTDEQLAHQLIKYRQREGYTHERLIRLSHPSSPNTSPARHDMYDWLRGRGMVEESNGTKSTEVGRLPNLPAQVRAHVQAMKQEDNNEHDIKNIASLVTEYNLPWEALPTWANTKPEVWQAMLPSMPLNAMIRNLGNMTRIGVFKDGYFVEEVVARLQNEAYIKRARIHPFNILTANKVYLNGRGFRGTNSWSPIPAISYAFEDAFYRSFKFIEPTSQRIMLALDVSGSMNSQMNNSPLTVREASAAMAMATLRTEENAFVTGFTSLHGHNSGADISRLNIAPTDTLSTVCSYTDRLPFNRTDCSLPMLFALEEQIAVDAFVIYTDSETYAGYIHPVEALRKYRRESGIEAKLVVVGMTSTGFSIADPNDAGMLDVVGFDSSAPSIISSFLRPQQALLEDNTSETSSSHGLTEEESTEPQGE